MRKWTEDEDDYLQLAFFDKESSISEIADFLGRSESAVRSRAYRLRKAGIELEKMDEYTDRQRNFIRRAYGNIPNKVIAEKVGRKPEAIVTYAYRNGLGNKNKLNKALVEELASQGKTYKEIAKETGATIGAVYDQAYRNGIKIKYDEHNRDIIKREINIFWNSFVKRRIEKNEI